MRTTTLIAGIVTLTAALGCENNGRQQQQKVDQAQAEADQKVAEAQREANEKAAQARAEADKKMAEAQQEFTKTREDYRHDVTTKLADLDKKIADLDAKVLKTTGDKKVELGNKASSLRSQRGAFAADVKSLDTTPAASWDATKARVDKEWSNIKSASDKIVW